MSRDFNSWEKEINQITYDYTKSEVKRTLDDSGASDIANEVGDAALKAAWGVTKFAFKWGTPIGWLCTYAKHKEEQERIEREIRARQEEERRRREEEERRRREEEAQRIRHMQEMEHRKKVIIWIVLAALLFLLIGFAFAFFGDVNFPWLHFEF